MKGMGIIKMESQKMDRRIRYTKMVIRDSLISLLKEKSISKITVKEICETADINRATFYTYYTDQFDLLYKIEIELVSDITEYLSADSNTEDISNASPDTLEKVFNYIKENSGLCSILLKDIGDTNFQNQIISLVEKQFTASWISQKNISSEDVSYLFTFTAVGSVGLIKKWLDDGMKKSAKEMADFILKVSLGGTESF